MEGNWRPTQPDASMASSMDAASGDWRNQLQPEARQRIVNKIMETLKRHLPTSVPEGLNELRKIAIRFEEKIYTAATSQLDYLGKLSVKMLSMETETQQSAPINPALSNAGGVNQNPTDPALGMQSHANNPGQPLAVPNRPEVLPQNLQNNTSAAMQGSSGPAPALTSISGQTQSNISGVTQASNLQNMPGISQGSVNNSMGPGALTDIYANARRQMQERQQQQQVISQQPQQQQQQQRQSQNPLMYQHQLQQRMLSQRMQQQQQQEQQQQQSLLQPNQLQSTQPSLMQMSSSLQSNQSNIQQTQAGSTESAPQSGLQQNQLNEIQQSVPSLLQSNPQSVARQQQAQSLHQQAPSLQQQSMPISQQSNLSQQQQQMMDQQGNMPNMQQNQLLGPQNSIGDIQQQQPRLPIQQNSFLNMKQQQQMMNQQTLALLQQQQQLGSQSCMSGLQQQQQMLGPLTSVSNMQPHQRVMLVQKNAAQQQQQQQQLPLTLLQPQGPQSQHQSLQQQLMSQYQSQPAQSQQQLMMQQQSNSLQREIQQRLQGSGPLVQAQNAMEQKPFIQAQRGLPEVSSSTSMDSTAQTGHAGGVDWREECYQKVKAMKELYFADLTEFHQKIAQKLQQQEALIPPGKQSQQHEKLKSFRIMLERMLALLQINKNNIPVGMKEKLTMYEKQMMNMVAVNRSKKISPQVQGQQQLQHPNLGNAHPIPQQQQSQVSQMHPDNQANQVQQIIQGPGTSLQQSVSSVQHVSMHLSTAHQSISNTLQPSSNIDSVQGVLIYELVTLSCLNRPNNNKRQQILTNTSIINCESYSISEEDSATKRVEVSEKVVPEETSSGHFCTGGTEKAKEPTFNCPICMCTMVSPFSTICGHIFCEDCIRSAIKRRKECPTCRAKLTGKNNIHRVFLPTAD